MLSIRKQKGFKMILNSFEHGELESFTLIHLNDIEEELFLREVGLKPFVGRKVINYTTNDTYDELFKRFANEHSKNNKEFIKDISKVWYNNKVPGKWTLIRDPDKHIIKLRPNEDKNTYNGINRLNLTYEASSQFCKDCRKTKHPNKYYLSMKDGWLYDYWSSYMNAKWLKEVHGRWMPY